MLSCLYLYLYLISASHVYLSNSCHSTTTASPTASSSSSSTTSSTASHWLAWSSLSSLSSCRLRWLALSPSLGPAGQTCLVLLLIRDLFSPSTILLSLICSSSAPSYCLSSSASHHCLSASSLPAPLLHGVDVICAQASLSKPLTLLFYLKPSTNL